ncbi:hypothetical protein K469DRAFT_744152 [Zopfia rhizophila CBS 207.26]|uniref:C2H2-type domain-containing protein n=1 Tax=Zopfia rhizophila CBS 207.26 TaxID=1314779 RepID=A0A6A6EWJ5_9PEZI|nr:hypothetical protein K469DRAFT_744152 [Zopfia rhizophila CBS 207.26]
MTIPFCSGIELGNPGPGPPAIAISEDASSSLRCDYTAPAEWGLGNLSSRPTLAGLSDYSLENADVEACNFSLDSTDILLLSNLLTPPTASSSLSNSGGFDGFENTSEIAHGPHSPRQSSPAPAQEDATLPSVPTSTCPGQASSAPATSTLPAATGSPLRSRVSIDQPAPQFPCSECSARFTSPGQLRTHKNKAHKRYKCKLCPLDYACAKSLREHRQAVHEGIKHVCNTCGRRFAKRSNLKRHSDVIHRLNRQEAINADITGPVVRTRQESGEILELFS